VSGCCPLVNGTTPPGPTPPSSAGCENTVLVQASDPFATLPAPVAGVITLAPDTLYRFCGPVDIGPNLLDQPSSTVVAGDDPLVDSITGTQSTVVRMREGGTIKDVAIRNAELIGSAILVGGTAGSSVPAAVIFNVSVSSADDGTLVLGQVAAITFARYLSQASRHSIRVGGPEARTVAGAISVDQAVLTSTQADFRGIQVHASASIGSFAFAQTLTAGADATAVGVEIQTPLVTTIRASSCAFAGLGTPDIIAQPPPLAAGTFGSAVQSESVGCVGFENSLQRGSATLQNALTPIPAVGTPVPLGEPVDSYTLDASSVRVSLVGATAPTQVLRFDRVAPYSGLVAVSLSIEVAVGFTFTPRVIRAGVLKNGVPIGVPFAATTPDFSSAAPVSLSFATPTELVGGDELQVLVSNETDAADLFVRAARVTVT